MFSDVFPRNDTIMKYTYFLYHGSVLIDTFSLSEPEAKRLNKERYLNSPFVLVGFFDY
jgi:hypothetical protein